MSELNEQKNSVTNLVILKIMKSRCLLYIIYITFYDYMEHYKHMSGISPHIARKAFMSVLEIFSRSQAFLAKI